MDPINIQYFKTAYGELILGSHDNHLIMADWRYRKMRDRIDKRIQSCLNASYIEKASDVLDLTRQQLNDYFNNERRNFDIPLKLIGTEFQKKVWNNLIKINYGKTTSYLELATNISKPQAVRAVANANGANVMSIIIPCHRVIGSNGTLGGYAGGLPTKRKLLDLEQSLFA
ncbi:MAG: methylated-DNA--[protein]-cysteine S-methyltransferase [Gammaproteobacteria bacterium]|nr:methylated-DNA--[protein]-cysteine S-methyltransferase [Gammaproteobacteria bacterium]